MHGWAGWLGSVVSSEAGVRIGMNELMHALNGRKRPKKGIPNKSYMSVIFAVFLLFLGVGAELIYQTPEYPVQQPNMTIGSLFPTTKNGHVNVEGVEQLLATICTLDCFNRGSGEFPFSGILNLISYDSTGTIYSSQAAAMKLLQHNLHGIGNDNGNTEAPEIAAIVASLNTLQYLALFPVFADYFFPVVGVDFLGYGIPYAEYPGLKLFKPRNVPAPFVISSSATLALATAVVQLLQQMNWTLSTVLYGPDVFGMEGQTFLPSLYPAYGLTQACSTILVADKIETETDKIVSCLQERQSRVIVYWSGQIGRNVTEVLQEKLGGSLIFIFPGKYALQERVTSSNSSASFADFASSFIFDYPTVALPQRCLLECFNDGFTQKLPPSVLQAYWQEKFNCTFGSAGCPSSLSTIDYEPVRAG